MTTKKLVPRASGEGAMGVTDNAWGEAYYDTGNFNKGLFLKGSGIEDVIANTVTQGGLGGEWTRNGLDIYYNGGNVGIGTTDPNYGTPAGHATGSMFGLKNTLSSSLSLFRDDASIVNANAIGGMFFYGNGSTDGINPVSPKELASIECFADENHLDDSHKSNLTFATNSGSESTRRMVINSEGLHIEGNSLIVNTEDSAEGKSIYFRWSDGAAINSDSYLTFGTSSIPTERMRIDANGDVGIGTTNPSARLSVVGSDLNNDDDLITLGGRYNTPSTAFLASIGTHHSDVNNGGIKFSTKQNGTVAERLRIDEAGSVGIGTTSPSSKLHITATHSDTNSIDNLLTLEAVEKSGQDLQPGDGLGILFKVPVGNNETSAIGARIAAVREGGTEAATSTELVFEVSQEDETLDEAMRIDRDGNVGIGAANPGERLDVNGRIRIENSTTPTTTSNRLYAVGGNLFWDGENVLHARDTIGEMEDTSIGTKSNGQVLIWNATSSKWVNNALTGGNGIDVTNAAGGITISHTDTSSATSSNNSGRTYIQDIGLDEYGHVTSLSTATETVVDTNTWRAISSTPTNGATTTSISSDWAFDNVKTAVPANAVFTDTDTNTWRAISSTPTDGATTTSISSDWAFDNVKTAVPANAVFTDTVPTFSYNSTTKTLTITT